MILTFFFAMVMNIMRFKNENILGGEDVPELNNCLNDKSYVRNRSGLDERNCTMIENVETLEYLSDNFKKLTLLKSLQKNDSVINKLNLIDDAINNGLLKDDSYTFNVSKGGLLDDWNFTF